jgi:phosphatidylglycerol:prolipoprotein diacylglycerol transferase
VRPTLFTLPLGAHGLGVHSYGLAIAVGFAVGVVLAAREAGRRGLEAGAMLDLLFWVLVSGIAGSRMAFVLLRAGDYWALCRTSLAGCAAPLRLWEGGLVFYGGALAATGVAALFAWRRRWSFPLVADVLAPSLALGHAFGRLGCFFAGCCFGKPWAHGLSFPAGSVAHDDLVRAQGLSLATTPPLHPVQLYESLGELAIFFLLLLWRRRQRFAGATALLYGMAYAGLRFMTEIFRGDAGRGFLAALPTPRLAQALGLPPEQALFVSTSQAASVAIALGAAIWWMRLSRAGAEKAIAQT